MRRAILAGAGLCLVIGIAYLAMMGGEDDPVISQVSFERTGERTSVVVIFQAACDEGGPHLYLEDPTAEPRYLLLRETPGTPSPEDGPHAVPGNRFQLDGYPVARHAGDVTQAGWFDVLGWSALQPIQVWRRDPETGDLRKIPSDEPLQYAPDSATPEQDFAPRHYTAFTC